MSSASTTETPLVYGRDEYIAKIWKTLDGNPPLVPGKSIYINDLRRIGKTYVLDELERNPRGYIVASWSVEGHGDASKFAAQVFNSVRSHLSTANQVSGWIAKVVDQWKGASVDGVLTLPEGSNAPWVDILERTFRDLQSALNEKKTKIVFLWDELPDLLNSIINNETERKKGFNNASLLLGALRSARENHPRIRMVFTGSIGIHHVLAKLRHSGCTGEPLNDMAHMPPGPLSLEAGVQFASALLTSEGIVDTGNVLARKIAATVGNIPFYIKELVRDVTLDLRGARLTPKHINDAVRDALVCNKWELKHFFDRIKNDYGNEDTPLVLAILDIVATHDLLTAKELMDKLPALPGTRMSDAEHIRHLLDLLGKDHYLIRAKKEPCGYLFKYDFIRRWWCMYRELTPVKLSTSTR